MAATAVLRETKERLALPIALSRHRGPATKYWPAHKPKQPRAPRATEEFPGGDAEESGLTEEEQQHVNLLLLEASSHGFKASRGAEEEKGLAAHKCVDLVGLQTSIAGR